MNVLEALSGLAVRHMPREHVLRLREVYQGTRKKLYPLLRVAYGTFDARDLREHLEEHIGRQFEILMVHSSMNHMLPMYTGTALELVQMLLDYCGPARTLAMPAFYFGDPKLDDVAEHYRRKPRFDVRRTPSQMGIVTELFRRSGGVRQSVHPTHRVAASGPLADDLTRGHQTAGSTFGRGTPFEYMAAHDTCIIGIGKPIEVLSQVHHVEDLLDDAFPVSSTVMSVPVRVCDSRGEEHPFELRWRTFERPRDMWKLHALMRENGSALREWRFHHVPMFAARASDVTEALVRAARNEGKTLYVGD